MGARDGDQVAVESGIKFQVTRSKSQVQVTSHKSRVQVTSHGSKSQVTSHKFQSSVGSSKFACRPSGVGLTCDVDLETWNLPTQVRKRGAFRSSATNRLSVEHHS